MIVRKIKVNEYEYQPPINYVAGATEPDIQFQITDYVIPSGAEARAFVQRFDGTFEYTVATIDDQNITIEPTGSMFSVKGEGAIQVTLYVGDEVVKNFSVPVFVHADLADDAAQEGHDIVSIFHESEQAALEQFREDAEEIAEEVTESIPSDYTALSNEVDELNERLDSIVSTPSAVRRAIYELAMKSGYADTNRVSANLAILQAWQDTTVTAIELNTDTLSFNSASSQTLRAILTPRDAEDTVYWTSSNTAIATVTQAGVVTAVGDGTCTITASVGSLSATCTVSVTDVSTWYDVHATLMNITSTGESSTPEGQTYEATLSRTPTYIIVTMAGTDITSSVVSGANISIPNVSGEINIFAYKKTEATVTGYTFYDYVKGTASGSLIDTGDIYEPSFGVLDCEFIFKDGNSASKNIPIMGCRNVDSNVGVASSQFAFQQATSTNSSQLNLAFNGYDATYYGTPVMPTKMNAINTVKYEYSDSDTVPSTVRVNGVNHSYPSFAKANMVPNDTISLAIFTSKKPDGGWAGSSVYTIQIGEIRFWNGNTLVHDYIPAKEASTNHYGMYDLVDGEFHGIRRDSALTTYSGTAGNW